MQRKEVVPGHASPAEAGVGGTAAKEWDALLIQISAVDDGLEPN